MENKKAPKGELDEKNNEMCCGNGLISKGFERLMSRDGDNGYVRVSFTVEWSGYFVKKDFSEVIDNSIDQINDFLFSDEEGE